MRIEKHPYNYPISRRFPDKELFAGLEGGTLWLAQKDEKFYLIIDEGTQADLLTDEDADLLDQLTKICIFDTEEERDQYINQRGWRKLDRRKERS